MCGIAGVIDFRGITQDQEGQVKAVTRKLAHRGPDDEGFYGEKLFFFGHRRLSILDPNPIANQPFTIEEHGVCMVFNGEVYNYQELKVELQKDYTFKTNNSDTEVLLYAYVKWGIDFVKKLTGMFALAIFDSKLNKAYLVRDRIGQKPLYYSVSNSSFYFSSEAQALFANEEIKKEINDDAIYHYLTFLTVPAPQSFFKNVHKLECGHYLELNKEGVHKICYWNISDYLNQNNSASYQNAIEQTEELLAKSMRHRNISDVPIALALSGGLDSSLNLFYSASLSKPQAINIAYKEENEFNESQLASQLAKDLNTKLNQKVVDSEEFRRLILEYLPLQEDQPMGDVNGAFIYFMSKWCREIGSKVMIVGEGGDEIGGYPSYLHFEKQSKKLKIISSFSYFFPFLPYKLRKRYDVFYDGDLVSGRHIQGFKEIEKAALWKKEKPKKSSYHYLKELGDQINSTSNDNYLRKVLNIEYKLRLPEQVLTRLDYPSMQASIEVRSPFMDHKLIQYSAQLPFKIKMKKGPKSILFEIGRNKLPSYILEHKKVGFGMLLSPFMEDILPTWFQDEILNNHSPLKDYLSEKELAKVLKNHQKKKNTGFKLWILYALHHWLKIHKE